MNYKYSDLMKMINKGIEPFIIYHITKEEVLTGDMRGLDEYFKLATRLGSYGRQNLSIACSGYDDVPDELYEIPEVRKYVQKMFKRYPYMLYYINTETESEHWLLSSVADEVNSVVQGDYADTKLTALELVEKYGFDTPRFHAMLTFKNGSLVDILKPIIAHGKKIKDPENAKKIAIEYAMRFDNWENTLAEMGIRRL